MPESFTYDCNCEPLPGTVPPIANYVVSIDGLRGIISLGDTGSIVWRTENNTIYADFTAAAGLGSVTSVAVSSPNTNLIVSSGSPVTTSGTIVIDLDLALESIAGLTTAADKMIYTTASNVYATTDLTAFARTLLDDAAATNARTTLGLVIGTDVQAFSSDLSAFVTNASWSGADLTLGGALTLTLGLTAGADSSVAGAFTATGLISGAAGGSFSGDVSAGTFTGDGSALTALNASNVSTGTLAVARGGTNIASYAIGDLIHATGATTLTKLPSVSAGSYLRSAGVTTASVWSTLKLPNSATVGDILYSNTTNNISNLADVATGSVLRSGGVGVAPNYGKVTSAHVDGTVPTMAGGINADLLGFSGDLSFTGITAFAGTVELGGVVKDINGDAGTAGMIFTSTGAGTDWTDQIAVSTLRVDNLLSSEGTITPGGTTGAQTINKMTGTVRFAAAAASLVVTNNLVTTSTRVLATVCTNDSTMKSVQAVVTTGSFTLFPNANPTAETEVFWELRGIT